jgi:hypothetical protein
MITCALLAILASPLYTPGLKRVVPDPCHPGKFVAVETRIVPVSIQRIDSTQIESLKQPNISEILARTNYPAAPIQTTSRLALFDGKRTAEGIQDLEKIEVLKGPQGTLYGANAVQGVLDILSKRDEFFDTTESWYYPNENLRDDSWKRIRVNFEYKDLFADTKIFSETTMEGHQPERTLIGESSIYLATYQVPRIEEEFLQDLGNFGGMDSNYYNLTGGVKFTSEYADKLGTNSLWLPRPNFDLKTGIDWTKQPLSNPGQYMQDSIRSFGQNWVQDWISRSGLPLNQIQNFMQGAAGSGTDMNNLNFPGNPSALGDARCGSEMYMGPGTLWYPDKPGYQSVSNITPFQYKFPTPGTALVPAQMRTHCVNMALKEPGEGVRYYPYSSPDHIWNRLATMSGQAMIRGPWDQARTWIYTDKASMNDINERVMLGVSPSQYVNGLYDVASLGGLRPKDYSSKTLFDPRLLASYGAKENAFDWFSSTAPLTSWNQFDSYLKSKPNEIMTMFSPNAKPEEKAHADRLFGNLLISPSVNVRKGTLSFLNGINTDYSRIASQAADLRYSLYSKDPAEVGLALDMCEKMQVGLPLNALIYVANHGANEDLREQAANILDDEN